MAKIILALDNFPHFSQIKNYLYDSLIPCLLYLEVMTYFTRHSLERISVMARTKLSQKSKIKLKTKLQMIPMLVKKGQVILQ